jgi:hypothetical protein
MSTSGSYRPRLAWNLRLRLQIDWIILVESLSMN